jgi:DNA-3-methyladenine glycosylase I
VNRDGFMYPYKEVFDGIYSTLKNIGPESRKKFDNDFNENKGYENHDYSDDEYFYKLKFIPFYSGFRAEIVKKKIDIINYYFPNYLKTSNYGDNDIERIMKDENMIKNEDKIRSCIINACTFKKIVDDYGSFQQYVNSFEMKDIYGKYSFENLMLFKEEIECKFRYLGLTTSYHFMTDIGLPVLKPDRVILRIFFRLGLIDTHKGKQLIDTPEGIKLIDTHKGEQLLKTVIQGRKMSEVVSCPIRAVDYTLWRFGQEGNEGVCLENNPRCDICEVKKFCIYYAHMILKT